MLGRNVNAMLMDWSFLLATKTTAGNGRSLGLGLSGNVQPGGAGPVGSGGADHEDPSPYPDQARLTPSSILEAETSSSPGREQEGRRRTPRHLVSTTPGLCSFPARPMWRVCGWLV